jgi:hypothetical protein
VGRGGALASIDSAKACPAKPADREFPNQPAFALTRFGAAASAHFAWPASQTDQHLNRAGRPETRHQGSRRRHLARQLHDYDLGYFDLEQKTLQPLDNPFGTRLSPMS